VNVNSIYIGTPFCQGGSVWRINPSRVGALSVSPYPARVTFRR
jgi:hypothetical protein